MEITTYTLNKTNGASYVVAVATVTQGEQLVRLVATGDTECEALGVLVQQSHAILGITLTRK